MRVLIVDDYPGAALSVQRLLEILGYTCETATTGQNALAKVELFDPDVVLLDIGLPDLTGYDVARAIRSRPGPKRVFIAALTGWTTPDDQEKAHAAGIDVHVPKPPDRETLEAVFAAARAASAR